MKRLKLLSSIMVLFMAIGFTSCDTEPVDPLLVGQNPDDNTPASFQVDFSNATYRATSTTAVVTNGVLTITATRDTGGVFTITVPATRGAHTASVMTYTPSATIPGMYTNTSTSNVSGTVNIASINTTTHKVTGTFNFTGYWYNPSANIPNLEFTNGIFTALPYTGDGVTGTASFAVKIDGAQYNASTYVATVGNGLTSITGFRGTGGEYVSIVLDAVTTGTYDARALMAYSPDGDEDNVYSNISLTEEDVSGTVTISQINTTNHTISGTFSFTGYRDGVANKAFTDGKFENIPYTEAGTTPTDDVFRATVDGTAYTYEGTDVVVGLVNDNQLTLQAFGDNHEIRLFMNNLGVGTYPFSATPTATAKAWFTDSSDVETAVSNGTLIITSKTSTRIAGTFSYTVTNDAGVATHTVTAGSFDVEYN
ncbi:DUF6252 family protein [Flavobacterium psychrotrophum]|uniref:DUF6252 family protein n=1 Tax=Flavobacterium psychrotrophum TaxID=2294119 RepID=UPI000E31C750|nr:DUF6252 family protein [Flavobacterium psychrotrophum]